MSFLAFPRLNFTGLFQADPSTVNNDPRHYSNEFFDPRFQEMQAGGRMNGWWNPMGIGVFRFADTRVASLWNDRGERITDPAADPVFGLAVGNTLDQSSAKIVDLDPDWQLASELYGLTVSFTDGRGRAVFSGRFETAPFRDLWFTRGGGPGDAGASASYQSVLTDLRWNIDGLGSAFLERLKEEADGCGGALSIRFATFAYCTTSTDPRFTYGSLIGSIGPYAAREPKSFVLGRRFVPSPEKAKAEARAFAVKSPLPHLQAAAPEAAATPDLTVTWFSGAVTTAPAGEEVTLNLDLSNALAVNRNGQFIDAGVVEVGILTDPSATAGSSIAAKDFERIGELCDYRTLQHVDGGILTLPVAAGRPRELIADHPLALVKADGNGGYTVLTREVPDGLEVRPETFTFRLHSDRHGPNQARTTFYAARYGTPIAGKSIVFDLEDQSLDSDNTPPDKTDATTPAAPAPSNNAPLRQIDVTPAQAVTDAEGKAEVVLSVTRPLGQPRGYFDGQLYVFNYNFRGATEETNPKSSYDRLAALVFTAYDAPRAPVWADIEPIMRQYANLYPAMSQRIFDFAEERQARANAQTLKFAFSQDPQDAGYMPVTRDLSNGKRETILTVLDSFIAEAGGERPPNAQRFAHRSGRCPLGHG